MSHTNDMSSSQLLDELINNDCLDLVKLYQKNPGRSFYALVQELYQLRRAHDIECRISPITSDIESLLAPLGTGPLSEAQFSQLVETLDLNQRAHKMSRFILTQDNHSMFAKPVDLVMFGDSITEWGPWHDALSGITLANRGLAGDTTSGMLQRLPTTTVCTPKLVCIMAGINDLSQGYSSAQVMSNYLKILDYWQDNNIEVWVQSTLFIGERIAQLNPKVEDLNQRLLEACKRRNLRFIDLNSVLCPAGHLPLEHSCDDLHLNSVAYLKWLTVLSPMLVERFS